MTSRTLVFEVPLKETLASNRIEHFIVAGKKVAALRQLAIDKGLEHHKKSNLKSINDRLEALRVRQAAHTAKTKASKLLKKSSLSAEEQKAKLDEEFGETTSYKAVDAIEVPFLYSKARVKVYIGGPTKREFDPPNFWPTIKAITDGLTDCAWWVDDNFNHVAEVSFAYGDRPETKGCYRFTLVIEEVE